MHNKSRQAALQKHWKRFQRLWLNTHSNLHLTWFNAVKIVALIDTTTNHFTITYPSPNSLDSPGKIKYETEWISQRLYIIS